MGLGMRPKLSFYTPPRWATGPGATTTKPDESKMDTGATPDEKPPAPEWNWLLNSQYECIQRINASLLFNWWHGETGLGVSDNYGFIVYHPAIYKWIIGYAAKYRVSEDGKEWSTDLVNVVSSDSNIAGIDTSRYVICGSAGGSLRYSTDATVWNSETITGMTDQPRSLCTKYPDSDYIIVGGNGGELYLASGGIGTSWSVATTPPSTSDQIVAICRTATDTFVLSTDTGYTFISTDGGDTWASTTTDPRDVYGTMIVNHMASNADETTLVCVGSQSSTRAVVYSNDNGTTWSAATIVEDGSTSPPLEMVSVYYCGGKIWVACGSKHINDSFNIITSYDNGVTWRRAAYNDPRTGGIVYNLKAIGSDGKQLILAGSNGTNIYSLALPGSTEG